jgi:hypothetical protein
MKIIPDIRFKYSSHRRHFVNEEEKYFLSANFKVMSSTLRAAEELELLSNNRILTEYLRKKFFLSDYMFYFIVRNPSERLQSFFRDKFRVHPNSFGVNNFEWQHPQILILKKLGIDLIDKKDPIYKDKLLSIDYSEFINILPEIYLDDSHLIPQHYLLDFFVGKYLMKLKPNKILKIENNADMSFIREKLKINTDKNINFTKEQFVDFSLTREQQDIISKIYYVDFKKFDYKLP